jgi:hypothetical protein
MRVVSTLLLVKYATTDGTTAACTAALSMPRSCVALRVADIDSVTDQGQYLHTSLHRGFAHTLLICQQLKSLLAPAAAASARIISYILSLRVSPAAAIAYATTTAI